MRACAVVLAAAAFLTACGPPPTCVDDEGEELPVCGYEGLEFCPGDHWASDDGCVSYACDETGEVVPTQDLCGA